MNQTLKRILGAIFWLVAISGVVFAFRSFDFVPASDLVDDRGDRNVTTANTSEAAASLIRYFSGPRQDFVAIDPTGELKVQDPFFVKDPNGEWRQAGFVSRVGIEEDKLVNVSWHAADFSPADHQFVQYRNSGNLEDVLQTMLPAETRDRVKRRLAAAMSEHGRELSDAFVPLVQASLRRSMPIIENELRRSITRNRGGIDRIVQRWNDDVVAKRLIPLARSEILPIARKHGQKPAEAIGRELWSKASLWRFGWRAIYDRAGIQKKRQLLLEEWNRFVKEEAIHVFEAHMDEVVTAIQRMTTDVIANEKVRSELESGATKVIADDETQALVRKILRETLIDNQRVRQVWTEVWTSDEARQALDLAGDKLEPVVRSIGDEFFGSEELGINPNFARVLRNQILRKDQRWIVATLPTSETQTDAIPNTVRESAATQNAPPVIRRSHQSEPYPIVHLANPDD